MATLLKIGNEISPGSYMVMYVMIKCISGANVNRKEAGPVFDELGALKDRCCEDCVAKSVG